MSVPMRGSIELSDGILHVDPALATSSKEQDLNMHSWSQSPSRRTTNPDVPGGQGGGGGGSARARLPEFVDKLELELAKCLATYREQAEECLFKHLEELEETQTYYEHQIAALTVENCTLRSQLGLKSSEQLQSIIFQSGRAGGVQARGRRGRIDDGENDALFTRQASKSSKAQTQLLNFRKSSPMDKVPGGTWQPFMAWVPNGAALQNPEPWKPLPTQELRISPNRVARAGSKTSTGMLPILPGTVPDVPAHTRLDIPALEPKREKKRGGDDSDSDGSSVSGCTSMEKEEYDLLELWIASAKQQRKMKRNSRSETPSSAAYRDEDPDFKNVPDKWFIVNPDSRPRITWDILSLVMISYDIVTIPMEFFLLPQSAFLVFFDWLTRLFWTCDIGWSCITGVVLADGIIEYELSAIMKRYGKSWFLPDFAMVASDWAGLLLGGDLNFSQLARITRIARAVRLVRLLRMQEVLANLSERIQSDIVEFAMQILKLLMVLAVASHFIACCWWAVGSSEGAEQTWIKESNYDKLDVGMQYLICLNWALCLFVGGSDDIFPISAAERFYAAIAGMAAFMLALVMLGTLTSGLTQRHIIDGSGARQMAVLKTYLRQNQIPKNLTKRLCRNAKHAISGDLNADAVQLLGVISTPLKVQMHFEMYSRIMVCHPFFYDLLQDGNALLRRIFHQAMGILLLASGDTVFDIWEEPTEPKMYVVATGSLDYCDAYGEVVPVAERSVVSEAVLWTRWRHQGTLSATCDVKMAMLDAQTFHELCKQAITKKNPACLAIMAYAAEFVKDLNRQERPTDLQSS